VFAGVQGSNSSLDDISGKGTEPSMTLAQLFENRFRGDIRFRGAAYLKAERVSITRVTSDEVFAVVRDGTEFQTQLRREESQLRMFCSCPLANNPEPACKHLWATILVVDAAGFVAGQVKPGYIPPFAVEPAPLDLGDVDWDEETLRDVFEPTTTRRPSNPSTVTVEPKLREWDAELVKLREALQAKDPARATAAREREIFYEIDVAQSRDAGQLVIQTSQRQRRGSGQWGKLKPLKLRPNSLDELEGIDRNIISYLIGGTPERSNWYAQQTEIQGTTFRYQLPQAVAELVLPMMCAGGRVQLMGDDGQVNKPLQWDGGAAWELCLGVEPDLAEQQWQLAGDLRRGDELLELADTVLLVPGGFVVTRERIAALQDGGAFEWVSLLRRAEPIVVPQGEEMELVDRLLDMPSLPRLELPPQLQLEAVTATPVPQLTIHSPRGVRWQRERLQGEVSFEYLGSPIRGTSPQGAIVQRDQGRCIPRDRQREEQAWTDLQQLGFRRVQEPHRGNCDIEISAKSLGPAVRGLIERGWLVRAAGQQVRQAGKLQFHVKSNIDWFELHADVDFEGRTVAFPELLSALARGDSTVRLDDGSLGILPEEWFRQYALLAGLGVSQEDHVRFARNQVGLLDALLAAQDHVDYDSTFAQLRERLQSFQGIGIVQEPDGFVGKLRDYQREGVGWLKFLQEFNFGGCLADDMGLGKTIQLLALLRDRHLAREVHKPSLVVVPKSLVFNWQQECKTFTPQLSVLEYTGLERSKLRKQFKQVDLILTTYGTLRRDILQLKDVEFDYVVLDEAQAIKNARSQIAKAARLLHADHRLALSGTPIENHLGDLWSIFEFLNPGMLGRATVFKPESLEATDQASRQVLAQALRPFILRRTKREVASELPEKVEQTIYCKMGEHQSKLYAELREHYRASLLGLVRREGLAKSKIHVLEALLRLRQAACHPALLNENSEDESSAKLDVLTWHLEELLSEGHKVLVFSQFTSMLAIVKKHLDKKNIVYEYLDGQTRRRKEHVERFQNDPSVGVFLISLKAGGLGLNLTAADYVFILDPWWNPAVEAQAIDRAHRIGQNRQVFAYRLICRDTVEEKIAALQEQKKDLADAILQADNNLIRDLTAEDLELLLS
jgi:superfamily II DNA or RNA helicase